jgi:DNA-binding response OmpR family regulator
MSREQTSSSAGANPKEASEIAKPTQQACVLLVEDDRSVRRYLEVTLQRSGYQVVTAADGLEAMKLALSSPINVIVTDAIMPNLSGQELARFLRSNPKLSHLPIVMLTGQENHEAATAGENLIDAFLIKPVKAEELKSCLTGLLHKNPQAPALPKE